jgi:glutamine amidotransferase
MKVAIIDYGAGNVTSVSNALKRLGVEVLITKDVETILKADKVIFPGVGHARFAMDNLISTGLDKLIPKLTKPTLGICLGFQLMCEHTEEGNVDGLSIFPSRVKAFPESELKIPHMGWNSITAKDSMLFSGITKAFFYHVHSYYVDANDNDLARCNYILPFATAMQKDNFYGVQFHPEKSAAVGETLLKNFIEL